jgi:hypothetical protein
MGNVPTGRGEMLIPKELQFKAGPRDITFNDPSAGSPTETLLRLLLPLNDRVWRTFRLGVVVANLPEPVRMPH